MIISIYNNFNYIILIWKKSLSSFFTSDVHIELLAVIDI